MPASLLAKVPTVPRSPLPLTLTLLWTAAVLSGCGSPAAPPAARTAPAARTEDGAIAQREQIAQMYAAYRAEAFAGVHEIGVHEVEAARATNDNASIILVDCREDRERAVSLIDGAISKAEFEADPSRYGDRVIVAYCTIGYRSGVYAASLSERGFDAKNLVGGVLAWAHDGQSFVGADGAETRNVHVYGAEWDLLPDSYESVYEGKTSP